MADVDPPAVFANGQICWQQLSHLSQQLPHTSPFQERGSVHILAYRRLLSSLWKALLRGEGISTPQHPYQDRHSIPANNGGREAWCEPSNQFA